ncbi:MAG: uroporphyrinogen decarboxylase family protein [Anaerolineae bacterium]
MPEKLFDTDILTKRERVERTLELAPVDRVALHDQVSYNPGVIAMYTGKDITGFDYTLEDICQVIRLTLDMCFRPRAPLGTDRVVSEDGFVSQHDNWTTWHVSRPFDDVDGAAAWLSRRVKRLAEAPFDAEQERRTYRDGMLALQALVGDTVICDYGGVGLSTCFDSMGLQLFCYLYADRPDLVCEHIRVSADHEVRLARAVADVSLSPVYLIADDFATKQGPIFSPAFLEREFFPHVHRVVDAWHAAGLKVLYHSDGNYKEVIPQLIEAGVDGFYCLEPAVGMDVVELKRRWPQVSWAGGVDGVDLMERGTPDEVRQAVCRQVLETDAFRCGGLFVGSSSEINPPIRPENYRAMVEAVGEMR